jgi:hypothetical protein
MKYKNKIISFFLLLTFTAFVSLSCQQQAGSNINASTNTAPTVKAQTPTEAFKMLYAAVKAKDTERIKQMMSRGTLVFADGYAQQTKQTVTKVLENGFTAPTLAESLPEIRDERVKDNFGRIEVRNDRENRWDDLPFVFEDDGWKLAVGDIFQNIFDPNQTLPKGKAQLEMDASNKAVPVPSGSVTKMPDDVDSNKSANLPPDGIKSIEVPKEKKP